MGTRHQQTVIAKTGERKISQYGQWDGYPSGQGIDILGWLRGADLVKYQENLENINPITNDQEREVYENKDWPNKYPFLSRDCGADIHPLIERGEVPFVHMLDDSEAASWCEGFYTLNFQKGIFTSEYDGVKVEYPLDGLPTDEDYLANW